MHRYLPLFVVVSCGVWLFTIGALVERLPNHHDHDVHMMANMPLTRHVHHSRDDIAARESVAIRRAREIEEPMRVLKEADSGDAVVDSETSLSKVTTKKTVLQEKHVDPLPQHTDEPQSVSSQIPNVLLFTHSINLLTYHPLTAQTNLTSEQLEEQEELLALQANVRATIDKHPNAKVRFLTDDDCIQSLKAALGDTTALVEYFAKETQGMYKADICRGAALWETGGIYLDVDVGARMPLVDVLDANTTFATTMVHRDSKHLGGFFQAFMATTPRHEILRRYLEMFLDHYEGKNPVKKGPLGVILLRRAFDEVILENPNQEVLAIDNQAYETIHKETDRHFRMGPRTVDTKRHGRIQLWQEILYNPKLFPNVDPAPTWGTRRACHFLVVASRKLPLTVPLYSRIAGSRMCPAKAKNDEKEKMQGDKKSDVVKGKSLQKLSSTQ